MLSLTRTFIDFNFNVKMYGKEIRIKPPKEQSLYIDFKGRLLMIVDIFLATYQFVNASLKENKRKILHLIYVESFCCRQLSDQQTAYTDTN